MTEIDSTAYAADMSEVRKVFTRSERDNWGIAEKIHKWVTLGVPVKQVGADSGMGDTNAKRYDKAWAYFGDNRIEGESFTGHAYLAVTSEEKAVKLLVEAQLHQRPIATLHRVMTNAVLDRASEEHSSSPDALIAAETVADRMASNPRLAAQAKAYAVEVKTKSEAKAKALLDSRNDSAPIRASVSSSGTIFLARMLKEAALSVKKVNDNDGFISDFDQLAEASRKLGEELHVYAAKRGLDTSLADLLGSVA
ncbi:MAG: hypothetical protein ABIQ39_05920 [Ilumatobacteraceae bacterium]